MPLVQFFGQRQLLYLRVLFPLTPLLQPYVTALHHKYARSVFMQVIEYIMGYFPEERHDKAKPPNDKQRNEQNAADESDHKLILNAHRFHLPFPIESYYQRFLLHRKCS